MQLMVSENARFVSFIPSCVSLPSLLVLRSFSAMRAGILSLAAKASSSAKPSKTPKPSSPPPAPPPPAPPLRRKAEPKPLVVRKMPVCKLSPALSDVLQVSEATRTDALKLIWNYIKAHNLQIESWEELAQSSKNTENKKEILCDEKLKKVFMHDKITIHEVVKSMSPHISKKNE